MHLDKIHPNLQMRRYFRQKHQKQLTNIRKREREQQKTHPGFVSGNLLPGGELYREVSEIPPNWMEIASSILKSAGFSNIVYVGTTYPLELSPDGLENLQDEWTAFRTENGYYAGTKNFADAFLLTSLYTS